MTRKFLILYHNNCYDGFGAAWAAKKWVDKHGLEAEFRGTNSGVTTKEDATGFTDILMLDTAYSPEMIEEYWRAGHEQILIIDHHKTNYEKLIDLARAGGYKLAGEPYLDILETRGKWAIFDMNRSGAGLTWDILHPRFERPRLINYIEDRDIWNHRLNDTFAINAAIMSNKLDFQTFENLADALEDNFEDCVFEGQAILKKISKDVEDLATIAMPMKIGGYEVPAVNVPWMYNSDLGNYLNKDKPFAATYFDSTTHTVVSLRSNKETGIDVSEIARKYPYGGGHKNAASFRMPLGWRGDS